MTIATLQEDDLEWTWADDSAARELLDASCSPRHHLRQAPPKPHLSHETHEVAPPRLPSVFNRDDVFCISPRLVDPKTGEIVLFCRSRRCEYCSRTLAIKLAFRILDVAKSTHLFEFGLTEIGQTPEEWQSKRSKFVRKLKALGVESIMAAEVAPETYRPHAHGFARLSRPVTKAQFRAAADSAGLGRVTLQKVPDKRAGLAKHYAYIFKSLDDPDPLVRQAFYDWNAYGSKVRFEWHSRDFFKIPNDDAPNVHEEAAVRPQKRRKDELPPEMTPTPFTASERSASNFLFQAVRSPKTVVGNALFHRLRGPPVSS